MNSENERIPPVYIIGIMTAYATNQEISVGVVEWLVSYGLAERVHLGPGRCKVTAKGEKWIQMLGETPLPEQKWIDPRL